MSRYHRKITPGQWRQMRMAILNRDGYQCRQCGGRTKLECDHKVPLAAGGTNDPDNLQILCKSCHIAKTRKENGAVDHPGCLDWMEFAAARRGERARMLEKLSRSRNLVHTKPVPRAAIAGVQSELSPVFGDKGGDKGRDKDNA